MMDIEKMIEQFRTAADKRKIVGSLAVGANLRKKTVVNGK